MSQPRRSWAFVIVNTHFGDSDGALGTQRGAKREAEKLSKVLSRLNHKVKLMHNKTAEEIEDLYQQECHQEHWEYFVSIVSSRGEEGVILGCDSEPIELICFAASEEEGRHNRPGRLGEEAPRYPGQEIALAA